MRKYDEYCSEVYLEDVAEENHKQCKKSWKRLVRKFYRDSNEFFWKLFLNKFTTNIVIAENALRKSGTNIPLKLYFENIQWWKL